jgi:hypothetical protein
MPVKTSEHRGRRFRRGLYPADLGSLKEIFEMPYEKLLATYGLQVGPV